MIESFITISLAGLISGFIFSMPVAGPISILIASNALKGNLKFCQFSAIGASVADFIYVFIAVFGLTKLYSLYKPLIPYMLFGGAFFLLYIGYKVFHTRLNLENVNNFRSLDKEIKKKESGAIYVGFMINFLNPTLFIGWLTTSFIMISFLASLGFNMGGLYSLIDQNVKDITKIEGGAIQQPQNHNYFQMDTTYIHKNEIKQQNLSSSPGNLTFFISLLYAFFISVGTIIWFYFFSLFLIRFRHRIKINIINMIIKSLAIILCFIGIYFGYAAFRVFF